MTSIQELATKTEERIRNGEKLSQIGLNMIGKIVTESNEYSKLIIEQLKKNKILTDQERQDKLREYTNEFVQHTEQAVDAIFAMEKLTADTSAFILNYPSKK